MLSPTVISIRREPWNKGKLVGRKAPLKLKDIWAIRVRLEMFDRQRTRVIQFGHRQQAPWLRSRTCECVMSPMASGSLLAQSSCNR